MWEMNKDDRVIYVDLLRVISTMAVIVLHVAAAEWNKFNIYSTQWQVLNIYDSLVRWSVPIFVMISGMFFLNPEKNITTSKIYKKYIPRIFGALLFFSLFYYVFIAILNGQTLDEIYVKEIINNIKTGVVRYHLWFLYLIIGLYIVTPILRTFIKNTEKKDIEYYLFIAFIFSAVIPLLIQFRPFNKILITFAKFNIGLMMGYSLYFVAGYYFYKFKLNKNYTRVLYFLGIMSSVATIILTNIISKRAGSPKTNFYEYLTPNVMFMSFAVFIFFKEVISKIKFNEFISKRIIAISSISFTIYLIHDAVRLILDKYIFHGININLAILVPLKSILIFMVSMILSYIIKLPSKMWKNRPNKYN